jgi:hypothetical protein
VRPFCLGSVAMVRLTCRRWLRLLCGEGLLSLPGIPGDESVFPPHHPELIASFEGSEQIRHIDESYNQQVDIVALRKNTELVIY